MKANSRMFLIVMFPGLVLGQGGGLGASPGSMFSASGRLADSTRDLRASQLDDIITILVTESASAVASGATNTSRKSSAKSGITALAGTLAAGNPLGSLADLSSTQQIQGTGQTSRNMTISTRLSARVVEVRPNGTLVVEGLKEVAINSERQTISVRGAVRPEDLTTANTVLSTQLAGLQVKVNGKGVVGDAVKRPFVLYRILLGLLPF
jgi:flagellar L-ring protein precursor FlgH